MRLAFSAIVLLALTSAALSGCGKRNPTSPPVVVVPGGTAGDFYKLWGRSYLDGAEFFTTGGDPHSQLVTMDVDGSPMAAALFRIEDPYDGRYVDAGTVRVWQSPVLGIGVDTLVRLSVPVRGTPWYLYTSVANLQAPPPIDFDGMVWHHFRLSGSSQIGAFEDSILSVKRPMIASPADGATVPRNSNLIVTWSDTSADTSIRVFGFVRSDVESRIGPGVGDARDPDGHATVDFEHAHLPAGSARLTVVRYRVSHRTIGPVGVVLKCEGISHRQLTLQ